MSAPKKAASASAKAAKAKAKAKSKAKAKTKTVKAKAKTAAKTADKAKTQATAQSSAAVASQVTRLKEASRKVEDRLKAVSHTMAAKLDQLEQLAEERLSSEKTQARLERLEKDMGRLVASADDQFTKARGALDREFKVLRTTFTQSAEKVIPAARARIRSFLPDDAGHGDVWEFYKDKAGKWRWRVKAENGKIVGASNQAFAARTDCVANARRLGYSGS